MELRIRNWLQLLRLFHLCSAVKSAEQKVKGVELKTHSNLADVYFKWHPFLQLRICIIGLF